MAAPKTVGQIDSHLASIALRYVPPKKLKAAMQAFAEDLARDPNTQNLRPEDVGEQRANAFFDAYANGNVFGRGPDGKKSPDAQMMKAEKKRPSSVEDERAKRGFNPWDT
jgi:hypothetical protein